MDGLLLIRWVVRCVSLCVSELMVLFFLLLFGLLDSGNSSELIFLL